MQSYLITEEISIKRQEGDTGRIEIILPGIIDPAAKTFHFQVKDASGDIIMQKDDTDFTVNGQNIFFDLIASDTVEKAGSYRWELEMRSQAEISTLARGNFYIVKEIIVYTEPEPEGE